MLMLVGREGELRLTTRSARKLEYAGDERGVRYKLGSDGRAGRVTYAMHKGSQK